MSSTVNLDRFVAFAACAARVQVVRTRLFLGLPGFALGALSACWSAEQMACAGLHTLGSVPYRRSTQNHAVHLIERALALISVKARRF